VVRNAPLTASWFLVLVGFLQASFLAEENKVAQGAFLFGYVISLFMVFFFSFIEFLKLVFSPDRAGRVLQTESRGSGDRDRAFGVRSFGTTANWLAGKRRLSSSVAFSTLRQDSAWPMSASWPVLQPRSDAHLASLGFLAQPSGTRPILRRTQNRAACA